jgi:hypothetical protein
MKIRMFAILLITASCSNHTPKTAHQKDTPEDDNPIIQKIRSQVPFESLRGNFNDLAIGKGINSATGNVGGYIVKDIDQRRDVDSVYFHNESSETQIFTSMESFIQAYSLNADANMKYGGFEATINMERKSSYTYNQHHEFIVFHAKTLKIHKTLNKLIFQQSMIDSAKKDPTQFILNNGDQVLTGVDIGGELFVVINITSTDSRTSESSRLQVAAAFKKIAFSITANANIQQSLEMARSLSNTDISIIASGIETKDVNFANVDSVTKLIANYNNLVLQGGTPIQYFKSSIGSFQGCPAELTDNKISRFISEKKAVLSKIESKIYDITFEQPMLKNMLDNPDKYLSSDVTAADNLFTIKYDLERLRLG